VHCATADCCSAGVLAFLCNAFCTLPPTLLPFFRTSSLSAPSSPSRLAMVPRIADAPTTWPFSLANNKPITAPPTTSSYLFFFLFSLYLSLSTASFLFYTSLSRTRVSVTLIFAHFQFLTSTVRFLNFIIREPLKSNKICIASTIVFCLTQLINFCFFTHYARDFTVSVYLKLSYLTGPQH